MPGVAAAPSPSLSSLSIRDQTEPFRLVTAIFPIDALTPIWKEGTNRALNVPHKRRLCQAFRKELHRADLHNALRVLCSRDEVDRMMAKLAEGGKASGDEESGVGKAWPSFMAWAQVNTEPVELMAGNHRVEALKEYLKSHHNAVGERWWLCDVYDRGE